MKNEERILEAALKVVKDYTISGTRMRLIADRAEMLQSNIHYYYRTKDQLMLALQGKVLDKCLELRADIKKDSIDTLESQLDVFIAQKKAFITKYREYDCAELDFWVQSRVSPQIKKGFAESFAGWRKDIGEVLNQYIPDLSEKDRVQLSSHIVSILEGATIQYLIDENCFDLDEYFAYGKRMILLTIEEYRGRGEERC